MLLTNLFDEVIKESSSSTTRPVDIAVKLAIVDVVRHLEHVRGQTEMDAIETIRDLLNLDNSPNVRVSRSKGIVKFATEQFVANAKEATELVERALINRRYRLDPDSFIML